ncbi:hypothetical protein DYB25_002662 [Aphanomyces astaci]|uniref:Scavenger receptor class B member 1 n=1 Tax=Aphanomyces astaci TaxID=112090 RepID=A0A397ATL7_APHAT|nr:hypothetical protein DYB25_002662 [Aphanomyces astaci]RHY38724.1 hypothetical protein DYB30_003009 [Aphanomyces astaci]RHZ39048.1 hypothetical protein DYB26_002021 [Aphanomyces astaci]
MCVVVAICLLVVGIVLLSYGGINATYKTKRIQLAQPQLPISTDPAAYSAFLASPTIGYHLQEPQSTSFYVFNVTNAGEVVQGALPLVQQVGPYVYTQTSEKLGVAVSTAAAAATVSYRVHTSYQFDALRSNGSESDVNVTYARTLAKLAAAGFSERTLAASFAHTQLTSFEAFFRGPFLAQTKQRALGSYLQSMDTSVRQAALPAALTAFRAQVASQTLPQHATHLFSHVRQARVPGMLSSLYDSFLVQYIPATLTGQYDSLSRLSLPRVLSNVVSRMTVEVTPSVTLRRERQLRQEATPALLSTMLPRVLENIALPYIVQEYMEQACFEAVPSMLNTIKNELVQAAVAQRILPTEAHQNTLLLWMQSESPSTSWTNVDALVGGAPTGVPRVGFELNSIPVASNSTVSRTLSLEVAALLFHEKANVEFSLLTYDRADTTRGFGLWKQAVALNADAIARLLAGVNNEVATPSDYLTLAQILGIRDYILYWSQSSIVRRDRQRYWAMAYTARTTNSLPEPDVDLDWETVGVQPGFSLVAVGGTDVGLSDATVEKLWDGTTSPSFLSPQGYILWSQAMASDTAAKTSIATTFGLSSPQLTSILDWLTGVVISATFKRHVVRHWAQGGTSPSPFNNVTDVQWFDLEPAIGLAQGGFELPYDATLSWPDTLAETLWDSTQPQAFVSTAGFNTWKTILVTPTGLSDMTTALNGLGHGTVTERHVRQWMTMQNSSSSLLSSWNAQIVATCANLTGGANSAVFATGLAGSCGLATLPDVAAVQLYVQHMAQDPYVKAALLAQWRCGTTDIWDVEPYRDGLQGGWELCRNRTTCGLASANNTVCAVPTTAFQVWDPSAAASLVNPIT